MRVHISIFWLAQQPFVIAHSLQHAAAQLDWVPKVWTAVVVIVVKVIDHCCDYQRVCLHDQQQQQQQQQQQVAIIAMIAFRGDAACRVQQQLRMPMGVAS
jgi:hypothetical protein